MDETTDNWVTPQIEAAKATVQKISAEESSLQKTLSNIKDARPFEDLTVSLGGRVLSVFVRLAAGFG
jgi:F-type H+-transporting ATPase subunit d